MGKCKINATEHVCMFAIKPEVEIWPLVGCFRFVAERTYLSMVSEKIRRISSETAEIYRVKLGPSAQYGIACKVQSSFIENQKKFWSRQNMPKRVEIV